MPADPAGQGTQADTENASTPEQRATDKQTTDAPLSGAAGEAAVKEGAVNVSALDANLEIPSEILAQLPKLEPDEAEPRIDPDPADAGPIEAAAEKKAADAKGAEAKKSEDDDKDEDEPPAAEGEDNLDGKSPDELKKIAAGRQKRINRLNRQKWRLDEQLDKAESEAKKLRGELEQQAGSTAGHSGKMPELRSNEWFPDEETAQTHSTLSAERDKADAVIQWCNEHSDGATTVEGDKETFITPQQVAQWKSRAEGDRLRVAPEIAVIEREAKQVYRVQKSQNDEVSKKIWPALFDKSTQAYQFAQSTFREHPSIKASPAANWLIGVHLEGLAALKARSQKANGNGADKPRHDISPRAFEPRVPIAPHTPEPPSREATPSSTKRYNEAMSNLKNDPDGSAASLAAVFAAEDEMSKTRAGSRTPVRV